ncbi:ABC-type multidrug transport system ATPase subunit [Massilia aurea]|uniref:ABC-type multidrug transport system ATPase subunit n=1 Tax=Massilia aurea TaxID=373040 RepID=A0A7W9WZ21_9BURK|nr:ABC transporter ATP-binding protein [Massilia aurea]MBB6133478.1 ABC-type multidrug transport system ATPase subunit [Massilia aurea]
MTMLLTAEGLCMRYGGQVVFEDLHLAFGAGAVALVGRNGAGKSTLLALLAGLDAPQAGRVLVCGHDLARGQGARAALAWVPDASVAYDFMTGDEFLRMVQALRGCAGPHRALLEGFGIAAYLGARFGDMSLGTRKKLMLAAGLMGDAQVVLMDEPTNGIDADARAFLVDQIKARAHKRLVLFSTHDRDLIALTGARVQALPARDA